MKWNVAYTEAAEQDLNNIYEYYSEIRLETATAKRLITNLIEVADSLETMPFRYPTYPNEPWKSKGIRTLYKYNHVILYLPDKSTTTVSILRIMYGGRNVDEHLV